MAKGWLGEAGPVVAWILHLIPVVAGALLLAMGRTTWDVLNVRREAPTPP